MFTNKNKYVSSSRAIHIFYALRQKVLSTLYFQYFREFFTRFLSHCILFFLAPEFEHAFGKANCQVLICLVLYG